MSDKEKRNPPSDTMAENQAEHPPMENSASSEQIAGEHGKTTPLAADPAGGKVESPTSASGAEVGDDMTSAVPHTPESEDAEDEQAARMNMAAEQNVKTSARNTAEPELEDERGTPAPTRCAKVFNGFAHVGPLVLIVAICCMVWPDFWEAYKGSGFYCPAEIPPITSFMRSIDQNTWLTPAALAGSGWIAQWPAYTWLLGLLSLVTAIPGVPADIIFPLAASLCACLGVLAVWGLAHAARFGSRAAFASGIILLCAPLFAPLPHFVGQSVLSATLMVLSLAFFCRGWIRERAWISLPIAFILCGLAGLSGGIFYLGIPLVASFCFLIWRGSLRRGQGKDALFGFALLLIMLGCWVSAVILLGSEGNYLADLFNSGLRFEWPMQSMWWLVFVIAAIGALPWLFIILGVSWVRVIAHSPSSFSASRHENGSALMWISITIACLAAPFFSHKPAIAIALLCLAAPLLGKAFMRMPPFGNKFFFFLASLLTLVIGLAMLCASFSFSQEWLLSICPANTPQWLAPALLSLDALPIMGGIVVLAGLVGLFVLARRYHEGGGLIFSLLVAVILCQPAVIMLAPGLASNPSASLLSLADIQAVYKKAADQLPAAVPTDTPEIKTIEPAPLETQEAVTPAAPEAAAPAPTQPEALPAMPEANLPPATPEEQPRLESAPAGNESATLPVSPAPATSPDAPAMNESSPANPQEEVSGQTPENPRSEGAEKPVPVIEEIVVEQPAANTEKTPEAAPENP